MDMQELEHWLDAPAQFILGSFWKWSDAVHSPLPVWPPWPFSAWLPLILICSHLARRPQRDTEAEYSQGGHWEARARDGMISQIWENCTLLCIMLGDSQRNGFQETLSFKMTFRRGPEEMSQQCMVVKCTAATQGDNLTLCLGNKTTR